MGDGEASAGERERTHAGEVLKMISDERIAEKIDVKKSEHGKQQRAEKNRRGKDGPKRAVAPPPKQTEHNEHRRERAVHS